jgi:hypothetical protein
MQIYCWLANILVTCHINIEHSFADWFYKSIEARFTGEWRGWNAA